MTTRQLLLLPTIWAICFAFSESIMGLIFGNTCSYPLIQIDVFTLKSLAVIGDTFQLQFGGWREIQPYLQEYVNGTLSPENPLPNHKPIVDTWGRPFQVSWPTDSEDGELGDVGFYSLGEDGISKSFGNDPDDINSWDRDSTRYYHSRFTRSNNFARAKVAAIIAIVVFFGMQLFYLARKKLSDSTKNVDQDF